MRVGVGDGLMVMVGVKVGVGEVVAVQVAGSVAGAITGWVGVTRTRGIDR